MPPPIPTPPTSASRIPIRKSSADSKLTEMKDVRPLELRTSNADKRTAWYKNMTSDESDQLETQNVTIDVDESSDLTKNKPIFPRIAVKSSPGTLVVRETEKIVDEKVTLRTEEVPCPITGVPHLRTVEVVEKIIETEVETCQEKIISLVLQDPTEMAITPTDDDASSSNFTVRGHAENSNLVNDNDTIDNNSTKLGSFNNHHHIIHSGSPIPSTSNLQTIVEVINPIIIGRGDGLANEIAIGRFADCAYHSLNDADMSYNSNNEYYELSLNDKMKNVLQELLGNEKVKLNLSRSLNEDDDTDDIEENGNQNNVKHDDCTNNLPNVILNDGECGIVKECDATMSLQVETFYVQDDDDDDDNNDDDVNRNENYKKSNIITNSCNDVVREDVVLDVVLDTDNCHVYENPNTECNFNDNTYIQQHQQQHQQQLSEKLSNEDEKLKEKFLSELHVDEVRRTAQSDAHNRQQHRRQPDDDESFQEVFETAATELNKNTNNNGKKKKRNKKNKKK